MTHYHIIMHLGLSCNIQSHEPNIMVSFSYYDSLLYDYHLELSREIILVKVR